MSRKPGQIECRRCKGSGRALEPVYEEEYADYGPRYLAGMTEDHEPASVPTWAMGECNNCGGEGYVDTPLMIAAMILPGKEADWSRSQSG